MKKSLLLFAILLIATSAIAQSSYREIDYSTLVVTDSTPVMGRFTKNANLMVDPHKELVTGGGFSFEAEEGRTYLITLEYNTDRIFENHVGFYLLKSGEWAGNLNDITLDMPTFSVTKTAMTSGTYRANSTETVRMLIFDRNLLDFDYSVTVSEFVSFASIDYRTLISTDGTPATGELIQPEHLVVDPYNTLITGYGLSFDAEKGKEYRISFEYVTFGAFNYDAGIYVLTHSALEGNRRDIVQRIHTSGDTNVISSSGYYTPFVTGKVRLLIFDEGQYDFKYTVRVREVAP